MRVKEFIEQLQKCNPESKVMVLGCDCNLIDSEEFDVKQWVDDWNKAIEEAISVIEDSPEEDFAPVVRCKDCIYSSFVSHCSKYECGRLEDILFFSDDFCSYGKRKENENA